LFVRSRTKIFNGFLTGGGRKVEKINMDTKMTVFSRRIFSKNFSKKKKVKTFSADGRQIFWFFFGKIFRKDASWKDDHFGIHIDFFDFLTSTTPTTTLYGVVVREVKKSKNQKINTDTKMIVFWRHMFLLKNFRAVKNKLFSSGNKK
jgi:hypothetical protein